MQTTLTHGCIPLTPLRKTKGDSSRCSERQGIPLTPLRKTKGRFLATLGMTRYGSE